MLPPFPLVVQTYFSLLRMVDFNAAFSPPSPFRKTIKPRDLDFSLDAKPRPQRSPQDLPRFFPPALFLLLKPPFCLPFLSTGGVSASRPLCGGHYVCPAMSLVFFICDSPRHVCLRAESGSLASLSGLKSYPRQANP